VITYLIPFAINSVGMRIACDFQAWAGSTPLPTDHPSGPVFTVPDGATEVTLTATPTMSLHWEKTVVLSIANGSVTPKAGSTVYVQATTTVNASLNYQHTMANVTLNRFKDVTADVFDLLKHPPATRRINGVDVKQVNVNGTDVSVADLEIARHRNVYGTWPPPDWGLHAVPDAHFLDPMTPVKSGALNFDKDPTLTVDVDSVVLRLAGARVPELYAVTWPKAIAPKPNAAPTPFLVFIRQGNQGNHYDDDGIFVGGDLQPYPNNFDYADTLFEQLHYAQTPFVAEWLKGVPYQVARSGKDVVTVVPCNSFEKEFGILQDTEQLGKILTDLQAFMFLRAGVQARPTSVGKTALASFSSANFFLGAWLADPANRSGNFLSKVVSAVYFLDPILFPGHPPDVNDFVASALQWSDAGTDKRIRLYMRYPAAAHKKLTGKDPSGGPFFGVSSDKRRTAAVLTDDNWAAAFKNAMGRSRKPEFGFSHHMIAATMLTHAVAQGDFT
jgi:hypothetical protein